MATKKTSVHFSSDDLKHIKWLTRRLGIKQGAVISMALKRMHTEEMQRLGWERDQKMLGEVTYAGGTGAVANRKPPLDYTKKERFD